MRKLANALIPVLLLVLVISIIGCSGGEETTPTPAPWTSPEPRSGLVTLELDTGVNTALSDNLPFSPVPEISRTLRVVKNGESYSFQFIDSDNFYLRNTADRPLEIIESSVTYGIGRLQLDRATYFRPVFFVMQVADTRLLLREIIIAPGETVEVRLMPVGSIEEWKQDISLSEMLSQYYPTEEQIKELWEECRRGWEDAMGTAVIDEYRLGFRIID